MSCYEILLEKYMLYCAIFVNAVKNLQTSAL